MIKSKDSIADRGLEIDLTGPDGNAYYLLGTAMSLARQFDIDGESIVNEMRSSDYEHLLEVFEDNFGEFVTLYRQTMKEVYIDNIGWCFELVTNRYNEDGINEPYCTYELIEK